MVVILVCKLVHVVQQHNRRGVFSGFFKGVGDIADEIIAALVATDDIGGQSAFGDEAFCHEAFPEPRIAVQQNPLRQLGAEPFIDFSVLNHVADLQQFFLNGLIADNFIKCAHSSFPPSLLMLSCSRNLWLTVSV